MITQNATLTSKHVVVRDRNRKVLVKDYDGKIPRGYEAVAFTDTLSEAYEAQTTLMVKGYIDWSE